MGMNLIKLAAKIFMFQLILDMKLYVYNRIIACLIKHDKPLSSQKLVRFSNRIYYDTTKLQKLQHCFEKRAGEKQM